MVLAAMCVLPAPPSAPAFTKTQGDAIGDVADKARDIGGVMVSGVGSEGTAVSVYLQGEPEASARPPVVEVDRNGDGRVDRVLTRPRGRSAGVYAVGGSRLTKVGRAEVRRVGPYEYGLGAKTKLLAASGKLRWRVVTLNVDGSRADAVPDQGFIVTKT